MYKNIYDYSGKNRILERSRSILQDEEQGMNSEVQGNVEEVWKLLLSFEKSGKIIISFESIFFICIKFYSK